MSGQRRAIGIVRVSDTTGRAGEHLASPKDQRDRIEAECERQEIELVEVMQELDVSGGTPLERRTGLRTAIEAIEQGKAEVIVAAYFDRLCRSLKVQGEMIERVEQAGGQVLAVDVGQVTNGSAGQWLTGTMHGMMAEYVRRMARERSGDATQRAIGRGVLPYPNVPAGYERNDDGKLIPSSVASVVAEAFRVRAGGATIETVTKYLRENGVQRSWYGVQKMLSSRVYLGEIHFGHFTPNLDAHPAIVPADIWRRVQKCEAKRGPRPKSERLLARLGILRCASCGTKLTTSGRTTAKKSYPNYRCPSMVCTDKVAISAKISEQAVTDAVRSGLQELRGRASEDQYVQDAERELAAAQEALDAAVEAFDGIDAGSANRKLKALTEARNAARAHYDQISSTQANVIEIDPEADWNDLTLDERRALIRARVESVIVAPANGLKGADRITITLYGFTTPRKGEIQRLRKGLGASVADAQKALDRAAQSRI
jgi:DNA invertase Pin-like site-specific DNA recombinase